MLTLHALSGQSSTQPLFQQMGITLLPGCLVQLKGGNGVGKTLLMEMIANKVPVTTDHITFAHQETRGDQEFFDDLHYIPQSQDHLPRRSTVLNYLHKIATKESKALVDAVLNYFDLRYVMNEKIGHLSPGWKQRLMLAPLILKPSAIWLLDRPFQSLDERAREQLEHLIAGRCRQHGIVLYVHDDDSRLNPHHRLDLTDWV